VSVHYVVSPVALEDIDAAAAFIAENDERAAERFLDQIYKAFETLAANPHRSSVKRPGLATTLM
jgi:plasmid stabilization system protein ParE